MSARKLLMLVTEDWYFWSHRLALARSARDAGFEVIIVTRLAQYEARIRAEGFRPVHVNLRRGKISPLRDARALLGLVALYRRERPDLVHHVAVKPVLYGSIAARLARVPRTVNALAGMGYLFISTRISARLARRLVVQGLRALRRKSGLQVIVQNPDDRDLLVRLNAVDAAHVSIVRGSGVDVNVFRPRPEPGGPPVVMLASRMLWDKGVGEFVTAARIVQRRHPSARFVLVGDTDAENPAGVPAAELLKWVGNDDVEWWGHRDDMPATLNDAAVVVLPSYREGLPKVLLEAAACGRPIVTTDVPGCREVVLDGQNGYLVPPRDSGRLAEAIGHLLDSSQLRVRMGRRGRELAEQEFSVERVVSETLQIYRDLLD